MSVVFIYGCSIVLGVELSPWTKIGPNFWVPHPHNFALNASVQVGRNCMIRHGVTIGNTSSLDRADTPSPVIGDNVEIGVGAVIIGDISVGNDARIGANSVVTSDVPPGALALGNPARILRSDVAP